MPVYYRGDFIDFVVNFEIITPENAEQKVGFKMNISFIEEIIENAFQREYEKVKQALEGWLVLEA